jgi:hypothetical protein
MSSDLRRRITGWRFDLAKVAAATRGKSADRTGDAADIAGQLDHVPQRSTTREDSSKKKGLNHPLDFANGSFFFAPVAEGV